MFKDLNTCGDCVKHVRFTDRSICVYTLEDRTKHYVACIYFKKYVVGDFSELRHSPNPLPDGIRLVFPRLERT